MDEDEAQGKDALRFADAELAGLPMPVALALHELAAVGEEPALMQLWRACEAVELCVRTTATILLSEALAADRMTALLPDLRSFNYRGPTLGQWKALMLVLAGEACTNPLTKKLHALGRRPNDANGNKPSPIKSFFDGEGSPEHLPGYYRRFTDLRNRLAHGAGLSETAAAGLLNEWRTRIGCYLRLTASAMAGIELLAELDGTTYRLQGLVPTPVPAEGDAAAPGVVHLYAHAGGPRLDLWPLMLFGVPRVPQEDSPMRPDDRAVQVYSSLDGRGRHQLRTYYTPLGCPDGSVHWCQGDPESTQRFLDIFKQLRVPEHDGPKDAWKSFEMELIDEAKQMMGRRELLRTLTAAVLDPEGRRWIWIAGAAGSGKSTLMAKLSLSLAKLAACEATADDEGMPGGRKRGPGSLLVIPYRFRAGDSRCSRMTFFELLGRSVKAAPATPDEANDVEQLAAQGLTARAVNGVQVVLLLDGLDEIYTVDADFLTVVLPRFMTATSAAAGRVTWVLAGRPDIERHLPAGMLRIFGTQGLPPMQDKDVRAMLLEQLGRQRLALLQRDKFQTRSVGRMQATPDIVAALDSGRVPSQVLELCKGTTVTEDTLRKSAAIDRGHIEGLRRWAIDDGDDDAEMFVATLRDGSAMLELEAESLNTRLGSGAFIAEVTRRAMGLPIYVKLVIDEYREGSGWNDFEHRRLPVSLLAFYNHLLKRHGIGEEHELKTPIVCALAVARDALTPEQLDLLVTLQHYRRSTPERRRDMLRGSLDMLMSMLSERPNVEGKMGYTIYHQTLREHLTRTADAGTRIEHGEAVQRARDRIADACSRASREGPEAADALQVYVEMFGIDHLLEEGRLADALRLFRNLASTGRPSASQLAQFASRCAAAIDDAFSGGCGAQDLPNVEAADLCTLIGYTYETGVYVGAIRLMIEYHPKAWFAELARRLESPYDLVFRHDVGDAYGEAWCNDLEKRSAYETELRAFAADAQHPYLREIAGYAFQTIYAEAEDDGQIDFALVERYAASPSPTDRMIAGELMLALALAHRVDLAGRIASASFWTPPWDYHARDISDILVLLPDIAPEGVRPDDASLLIHQYRQEQRALLSAETWFAAKDQRRSLLDWLGDEGEIDESKAMREFVLEEFGRAYDGPDRAVVVKFIGLLMCHPAWQVIEMGASLAAALIARNPVRMSLIDELLATDPAIWRVQYGAVDSAFNVGHLDGYAKFGQVLAQRHAATEARVRGLCSDDLLGWIRLTPPGQRDALLARPEVRQAITHWLGQGCDCWELEYAYLIVRFVKEWAAAEGGSYPWVQLIPERISPYLAGTPAFHELGHHEFLARIEGNRRAEIGRG